MSLELFERAFVRPRAGRTLIAGGKIHEGTGKRDRRSLYADVLSVDMEAGDGVDRVLDLEEPLPDDLGLFAHIECCSVLEHSRRPWLLAANLARLLEPGGTLFVSAPWAWRHHAYPADYYRFSPEAFEVLFPGVEWKALRLVTNEIVKGLKLPKATVGGHPFIARAETCGFGVKQEPR